MAAPYLLRCTSRRHFPLDMSHTRICPLRQTLTINAMVHLTCSIFWRTTGQQPCYHGNTNHTLTSTPRVKHGRVPWLAENTTCHLNQLESCTHVCLWHKHAKWLSLEAVSWWESPRVLRAPELKGAFDWEIRISISHCSTESVLKKDFCLTKSENGFRVLLWNPNFEIGIRISQSKAPKMYQTLLHRVSH